MITADRTVPTTCPYCGVGCGLQLHIKNDYIYKVTSSFDSVVNRGNLCVKGRFGYDFIYNKDRVTTPLIRKTSADRRARAPRPSIAITGAKSPGMKRSNIAPTGWSKFTSAMAPTPWRCTAAPRRLTKTITFYKRCTELCSAAITSIIAPVCVMPGRWSRCKWRSARRR